MPTNRDILGFGPSLETGPGGSQFPIEWGNWPPRPESTVPLSTELLLPKSAQQVIDLATTGRVEGGLGPVSDMLYT